MEQMIINRGAEAQVGPVFSETWKEVSRIAAEAEDVIVSSGNLRTQVVENHLVMSGDRLAPKYLLPHAESQLLNFIGMPLRYARQCMEEDRTKHLVPLNVNTWLQVKDKRRMLRTLGPSIRAFVSDSYRRLDHLAVLQVIGPEFFQASWSITEASLTDTHMYIKAVLGLTVTVPGVGDVVRVGVTITNSEVGAGAVRVQPYIWKPACSNGMILGRRADERVSVLSSTTEMPEDAATLLGARDVVRALQSGDTVQDVVGMIQRAAGMTVDAVEPKGVERLAKNLGFSEDEGGRLLGEAALLFGQPASGWDVANWVTAVARTTKDVDRAYDLEMAGGSIAMNPAGALSAVAS